MIKNICYDKVKLGLVFLCFLLLVLVGPIYASTLVEPGKFIFILKPEERITNTISVKNVGDKAAVVKATVYDWTLNDQDQMITSGLGSRKDSLKGCIKFNPHIFKLEPGANQLVRFTLTAPKDINVGELRGIVFFEEESQIVGKGVNAKLITQVGSTIYLALAPIQLKFRMESAKVVVSANNQVAGVIKVRNEGSSHVRYEINYKVINDKNVLVAQNQVKEKVLLPGFRREETFPIKGDFPDGIYNLLLEIKFFNTDKIMTHSVPFTVKKSI